MNWSLFWFFFFLKIAAVAADAHFTDADFGSLTRHDSSTHTHKRKRPSTDDQDKDYRPPGRLVPVVRHERVETYLRQLGQLGLRCVDSHICPNCFKTRREFFHVSIARDKASGWSTHMRCLSCRFNDEPPCYCQGKSLAMPHHPRCPTAVWRSWLESYESYESCTEPSGTGEYAPILPEHAWLENAVEPFIAPARKRQSDQTPMSGAVCLKLKQENEKGMQPAHPVNLATGDSSPLTPLSLLSPPSLSSCSPPLASPCASPTSFPLPSLSTPSSSANGSGCDGKDAKAEKDEKDDKTTARLEEPTPKRQYIPVEGLKFIEEMTAAQVDKLTQSIKCRTQELARCKGEMACKSVESYAALREFARKQTSHQALEAKFESELLDLVRRHELEVRQLKARQTQEQARSMAEIHRMATFVDTLKQQQGKLQAVLTDQEKILAEEQAHLDKMRSSRDWVKSVLACPKGRGFELEA